VWPVVSCGCWQATAEHGRGGADNKTASESLPLSWVQHQDRLMLCQISAQSEHVVNKKKQRGWEGERVPVQRVAMQVQLSWPMVVITPGHGIKSEQCAACSGAGHCRCLMYEVTGCCSGSKSPDLEECGVSRDQAAEAGGWWAQARTCGCGHPLATMTSHHRCSRWGLDGR
jgi:hypothetical protein